MSSEFTREVVMKFHQLNFHEFDVNVFKAILSIQTRYHKINHNSLRMHERRFEFDTGCDKG